MTSVTVQPAIIETRCDRCNGIIPQRIYSPHELSPTQHQISAYGLFGQIKDLCVSCTVAFDKFMHGA